MSIQEEYRRRYHEVRHRLMGARKAWHKPTVKLVWWTPKVVLIHASTLNAWAGKKVNSVIDRICLEHDVTREKLLSKERPKRKLSEARQHGYYLAMRDTHMSTVQIAKVFQKDHTSVLYGALRYAVRHNLPVPRATASRRGLRHRTLPNDRLSVMVNEYWNGSQAEQS